VHLPAELSRMKTFYLLFSFYCVNAIRIPLNPVTLAREQTDEGAFWKGLLSEESDMDDDEKKWMINLIKGAGISPMLYKSVYDHMQEVFGKNYNMTGRVISQWMIAAKEENLLVDGWKTKISDFGKAVPKIPRSWVKEIVKLDQTKHFRYMFSGSYMNMKKLKFRRWLPDFIKTNFGPEDYFRATDGGGGYKPIGAFDKTLEGEKGFRPKDACGTCTQYDDTYWAKMAESKFVIAPGGDAPYSFRYYESFLAGAIPIIHDYENDWKERGSTHWVTQIGYKHLMADGKHEFHQSVADLNKKKFLRYQTWTQGDHDPEADKASGFKFDEHVDHHVDQHVDQHVHQHVDQHVA